MHAEPMKKIFDAKLPLVLKAFMEAAVRYAGDKDALAEIYMLNNPNDPYSYWHTIHDRARWDAVYETMASPSTYAHAAFKLVRD